MSLKRAVKISKFLSDKDTDSIHDDVLALLGAYISMYPDKLPIILASTSQLASYALKEKDRKINEFDKALLYAVGFIKDSKTWRNFSSKSRATMGALILKPLFPKGKPGSHSQSEVEAFNAFREALSKVKGELVDSSWAKEIVPGMNRWLKKVVGDDESQE